MKLKFKPQVFADQCFMNSEATSNVKLALRDKGITIRML